MARRLYVAPHFIATRKHGQWSADACLQTTTGMQSIGSCKVVYGADVETLVFDWGTIRILGEPALTGGTTMTFAEVEVLPGTGHERHKHDDADEVIYVIEGEALQMLDDLPPVPVGPGASIFVPRGTFHGTQNTGQNVLRLVVVYAPAGEEKVLRALPGVRLKPAIR